MSQESQPRNAPSAGEPTEEMATANRSLADALRLSFRLLTGIMIVAVIALILTGMRQVDTNERGIRLLFGKIQGQQDDRMLDSGFKWSWPEPIGQIRTVSTEKQILEIDDFWMHETPAEAGQELSERTARRGGLEPGKDGMLLTGDRGLVHVKLRCEYGFRKRKEGEQIDPDAVISYLNLADARRLVRAAVCNAAIQASAQATAQAITAKDPKPFTDAITELAQKRLDLDKLQSGLSIESIQLTKSTPPLAARPAFDAVLSAHQEGKTIISDAKAKAHRLLSGTVGGEWRRLAGNLMEPGLLDGYAIARQTGNQGEAQATLKKIKAAGLLTIYPEKMEPTEAIDRLLKEADELGLIEIGRRAAERGKKDAAKALDREIEQIGLIRLYGRARESERAELAAELLAEIERTLLLDTTQGEAAELIQRAEGESTQISQRVAARAAQFTEYLPKYRRNPRLWLSRLWAEVKEDLLTSPTNIKFYLTPGKKLVIKLNASEMMKDVETELLKKQEK